MSDFRGCTKHYPGAANCDAPCEPDPPHGPLIEQAEYYAGVGERTFWNWWQTLTTDERRVVEHHMNRKDQ